jgi:hypothetical protein
MTGQDLIARAFEFQDQIGWGQAVRGRLCHLWTEANNQYRRERFNTAFSIPQLWTANAIFNMWKFGVACWIARNEFVYGSTEQEKIDKKNNAINLEIKSMYLLDREKINDDDNHLFEMRLVERLKPKLEQKQLWIARVKAVGEKHQITINSMWSATFFRGFLIRLDGN